MGFVKFELCSWGNEEKNIFSIMLTAKDINKL